MNVHRFRVINHILIVMCNLVSLHSMKTIPQIWLATYLSRVLTLGGTNYTDQTKEDEANGMLAS